MGYMTDLKKAIDRGDLKTERKVRADRIKEIQKKKDKALFEKHGGLTIGDYMKGKVTNIKEDEIEITGRLFDECDEDIVAGDDYLFSIYELNGCIELGDVLCFHGNEDIILYNKVTKEFKEEHTR